MDVIDLFSGAVGAWSLGMHRAGFRTVAACEADPWRRAIYAHNNPGIPIYDDVRTVTADRLRRDLGKLPPVVVGSPPCQDASSANTKGRGVEGERTGLFFEAIRIVGECRPRWCAFENSPMLRTRGYDRLFDAFRQAGYTCWPLVVGADDLEAPHERKRSWILAFNPDSDPGSLCAPTARADGYGIAGQRQAEAPNAGSWEQWVESWRRDGTCWTATAGAQSDCAQSSANLPGDRRGSWVEGRSDPGIAGQQNEQFPQTGDADSEGSQVWQSLGGDARAQFEALERAVGPAVHTWNGGVARHLRMAHGLGARLADIRVSDFKHPGATINAAKACISAHGDAILPQISEAIGRSILRVETALAAVNAAR